MRWLKLAVLSGIAASVVLFGAGCDSLNAPSQHNSPGTEYAYPQEDAIADSACPRTTPSTCSENQGHMGVDLANREIACKGLLDGLKITLKSQDDGTFLVTWTSSNPRVVVDGATDGNWQNNGDKEDTLFQSPYRSKPGDKKVVFHITADGLSQWDQIANPQNPCAS